MASDEEIDNNHESPGRWSWGTVLNRGMKEKVFGLLKGFGEEGGKSIGKLLFWLIIIFGGLYTLGTVVDSFTGFFGGWFTGWLDWLPFIGGNDEAEVTEVIKEISSDAEPNCDGLWGKYSPFFNSCKE